MFCVVLVSIDVHCMDQKTILHNMFVIFYVPSHIVLERRESEERYELSLNCNLFACDNVTLVEQMFNNI